MGVRLIGLLGIVFLYACSGAYEIRNSGSVDDRWAGKWQGLMLIENSLQPPKSVALEIDFTSTHIRAFYTDETEKVYRKQVNKLKIEGDAIRFQVAYETRRGLRAVLVFSGKRQGRSLMFELWGSEGGRTLRGKWEARQTEFRADPAAAKSISPPGGR